MSTNPALPLHTRFQGDALGTRYDWFRETECESSWTVVVCEDQPQLYTDLLRALVAEKILRAAMSVPFRVGSLNLLQCGFGQINGQNLFIDDPKKCIVILDLDADPREWDLLGGKPARREFTGAEFFMRLPIDLKRSAFVSSRYANSAASHDYVQQYPELAGVGLNAQHEVKVSNFAEPCLTEGAKDRIRQFIRARVQLAKEEL